jgi:hypothetical protein
MLNAVDKKIDEITQAHVAECEKLNVSRVVSVTTARINEALKAFSAIEILGSGYWTGLHDQAKVAAIRDALVELAEKVAAMTPKPAPAPQVDLEDAIEAAPAPKKKAVRATKGVALA